MKIKNTFRSVRNPSNKIIVFATLTLICIAGIIYNTFKLELEVSNVGMKTYLVAQNYERWDWNSYEFIEYENQRQGKAFQLTNPKDIELDEKFEKIK
jgi:hypothetical protein